MAMFYYRKPALGITGLSLKQTETGSTLAYYRPFAMAL